MVTAMILAAVAGFVVGKYGLGNCLRVAAAVVVGVLVAGLAGFMTYSAVMTYGPAVGVVTGVGWVAISMRMHWAALDAIWGRCE
jgi:hypothetical protein